MAASRGPSSSHCPSCGAPIASVESERCNYCGTTVNTHVAASKAAARQQEAATKRAWRSTWIYVAVFLGISVAMGARTQCNVKNAIEKAQHGSASQTTGAAARVAERQSLSLHELLATLPGPDGKLSVVGSGGATPNLALYLLDAATGTVRWKNAPWRSYLNDSQVVLTGNKLFVVEESRLAAIDVESGTTAWQASLVADYAPYTAGFRVVEDRVLVLVRDGSTQAFDANSGKTVWTHKQSPPPNRLVGAGSYLLEFPQRASGRKAAAEIAVVDVASGEVRQHLRSRCSTHSVIPADQPDVWAQTLFGGDGQELYLFYGTFRYCAERWNLATATLVWQTNQARQGQQLGHVSTDGAPVVMGKTHIIYRGDNMGIYAISRSTGELRKLVADPDHALAPMFLQDNLAVLAATPTWEGQECGAAKSCSLWGVDLAKGTVLWRHALPPDAGAGGRRTAERVQGKLLPGGLSLAQVAGEELIFDQVDLATGVSKRHGQIRHAAARPKPRYQDDMVWLSSGMIVAIDPATATVRYRLE